MSKQYRKSGTTIPIKEGNAEDAAAETGMPETEEVDVAEEAQAASPSVKPEEVSGEEDSDPLTVLEKKIVDLEEEKDLLNDKYLRLSAEFDNYKKRLDRQWEEFKRYAHESLAKELLTVVDNLERAIAAGESNADAQSECLIEGVGMTLTEILKVLERFHIRPIIAVGEPFDPNFHQAVAKQETADAAENIVLEEYQKGYLIHDRLLRPSMVVVAAATKKADEAANGD